MKKLFKLLLVIFMVGSLFSGCSKGENYVATINGQKITQNEYKYFLMVIKSNMEQSAGASDEESKKILWNGNIAGKNAEQYAKELALENNKEFKILLERATSAGYTVEEKKIETANLEIDSYVESLGSGETGVKKYEEQYGMSVDLLKAINKDLILVQNFYQDEIKKIKNTTEEVEKYYKENTDSYQKATIRQVVYMTMDQTTKETFPQGKQDVAKKNAEDILIRVKAGEDIGTLAKQYSEDISSKDNGGEYSFLKGEMVKELEDWAFGSKVGDVELLKTEYGYHVILLEKLLGFDEVRETVKSDLTLKKYNDQLAELKKSAKYEMKKNEKVYNSINIL